jgi:hypothetical protein
MKRIRFTEEQIIAVLREHEAGAKTADLARKHGISEATLYNWKAIYGPPPVGKRPLVSGPRGLHQSIRPVVGAFFAPGHDGFRASLSQLNYPACNRPLLPSGSQVTPVDRWSIILPFRPQTSSAKAAVRPPAWPDRMFLA